MNQTTRHKVIGCFAVVLFSSLSADALEIRMKRECRCASSLVRVADVADVLDTDASTAEAIAQISLFPTPSRLRCLSPQELQRILQLHGVDLVRCRFTGSNMIAVSPAPDTTAGHVAPVAKFTVTKSTLSSESVDVSGPSRIVVAARPLHRGETIRPADVELQESTGTPPQDAFLEIEDIVGMEAMRSYRVGQPIERNSVQPPVLVKRGETITVVAMASGVRVRTTAQALEDGRRGELIMVQGADKKQKYTARVADFQRAEVFAGGFRVLR